MEAPTTFADHVSASRVPAVLGMDPRCSPLTLFLRMRGELQEKDISDDEAVMQGRFYEQATAEIACHKYGMNLLPGFSQVELRKGCLSGHPDFLAIDEHGKVAVLEVKNPFFGHVNSEEWGDPGTDQVPRAYLIQTMVYIYLVRRMWLESPSPKPHGEREVADYGYVIARLGGTVERYKVPFDPQVIAEIEREVQMFLTRVQIDDAPTPQDEQDMRRRWPVTEGKVAECNEAFVAQLKQLKAINEQIKALNEQASAIKTIILGFAKDADRIELVDHETGARRLVATLGCDREFDADACWQQHSDRLIANGLVSIDRAALRKADKALYEAFMRRPTNRAEQKRVIRLKELEA